jgi:galactitol-specific phosphotransferase system IIB component
MTILDSLDKVGARKAKLVARLLREQIEAMRDAITEDNTTVVNAITAAEAEADKAAILVVTATVKSDANTQAAARVAAINLELDKLKAALS